MEETKQTGGSDEEEIRRGRDVARSCMDNAVRNIDMDPAQQIAEGKNWPLLLLTLGFLSVAVPVVHGVRSVYEGARNWYLLLRQLGKN